MRYQLEAVCTAFSRTVIRQNIISMNVNYVHSLFECLIGRYMLYCTDVERYVHSSEWFGIDVYTYGLYPLSLGLQFHALWVW